MAGDGDELLPGIVLLHKPSRESFLGLTLKGSAPPVVVEKLNPDGLAMGLVSIGSAVVSVNGQEVRTHGEATALLRAAEGDVRIGIAAAGALAGSAKRAHEGNHDDVERKLAPQL